MPRSNYRHLVWLPLTFMALMVVVLPLSYLIVPPLVEWRLVCNTTSTDLAKREKGLNFVARWAGNEPTVLRRAIARLDTPDDLNFVQIVNAIDAAGRWRRQAVPLEPWLRWLELLRKQSSPVSRILAAQHLADLADQAGDPRLAKMLEPLLRDGQSDVRYNALIAAAELAGALAHAGEAAPGSANVPAANPQALAQWQRLIVLASGDNEVEIARQAWIFLGLLGVDRQPAAKLGEVPAPVAQTMLWAGVRNGPTRGATLLPALQNQRLPLDLRGDSAWLLHLLPAPLGQQLFLQGIFSPTQLMTRDPARAYLMWRGVLAVPLTQEIPAATRSVDDSANSALPPAAVGLSRAVGQLLLNLGQQDLSALGLQADDLPAAVIFAARHRAAAAVLRPGPLQFPDAAPLGQLALLEGLPVGRQDVALPADMPLLQRVMATAVNQHPDPQALHEAFLSAQPAMRDLACVVAAQRFTPQQNTTLIAGLLAEFNDYGKMSGAILAGLTGLQGKLLAKEAAEEDLWQVQQIHRLGLWMQGQPVRDREGRTIHMEHLALALLSRQDMPATTVLLAMLHLGRPEALEYLLSPRTEERTLSSAAMNLHASVQEEESIPDQWLRDDDISVEADEPLAALPQLLPESEPRRGHGAGPMGSTPKRTPATQPARPTTAPADGADATPAAPPETSAQLAQTQPAQTQPAQVEPGLDLPPELPALGQSEPVTLVQLLDHYRWWIVLNCYLPPADQRPPFWLWADPALQQLQIDLLRNWYLLHRHTYRPQWRPWSDGPLARR